MRVAPFLGRLSAKISDDWEVDALSKPTTARTQSFSKNTVAICAGWRVVAEPLQWVLQHYRAPNWRNRAYCRTRSGLELAIREKIGKPYQGAVAHFPDWHPDVSEAPDPKPWVEAPSEVVYSPKPAQADALVPLPPLKANSHALKFYPDGFPVMPDFLRRRACSSASVVPEKKEQ